MDNERSYTKFARHVPDIIKPKPEDHGTYLCRTCLNPELRLICLGRVLLNSNLRINNVMEKTEAQLKEVHEYIEKSNLMFHFLEWKKSSVESNGKAKAITFTAKKTAIEADDKVFKSKLQSDLKAFKERAIKMIAQYRRVKQTRENGARCNLT